MEIEYEDEEYDPEPDDAGPDVDEKPLPVPHETQDTDAIDVDGDSPLPHDVLDPASRTGSGLGGRYEGGGAETEVEEGGSGLVPGSRSRVGRRAPPRVPPGAGGSGSGSGDRASPLDFTDEHEEDIMDAEGEMGYVVLGEEGFDVDGTVGGKRKR